MIILGLSGSICMGKTTTANMFKEHGITVFDADKTVHTLMQKDIELINTIGKIFPDSLKNGSIDRKILAGKVHKNSENFKKLEDVIHPFVFSKMLDFLDTNKLEKLVLLDIPLLFETGWNRYCDYVAVVYAPYEIQKQRAVSLRGMSPEKFDEINARQMSADEKKSMADFVVDTSKDKKTAMKQVAEIIKNLGN